jgi:serine/threonine protein kinase
MGMVFVAEDPHLERQVALKVMRPEVARRGGAGKRFSREARLAASINSDHIVTIYQVGEDRGVPFLAMELLQGSTLEAWLTEHSRPAVPDILRIGREIALGLAAAHERGLIHRDIKPANIWLETPDDRVRILEFGLARLADGSDNLTQSGSVVGTPAYIAPEQAEGGKVDARADLFSLGCVLYRLCTGQQAFQGATVLSILKALATHTPPPVAQSRPELPPALSALVNRLLAKDAAGRPATAREVAKEIAAIEAAITMPALPAEAICRTPPTLKQDPIAVDVTELMPARPPAVVSPAAGWRHGRWIAVAAALLTARPSRTAPASGRSS